VIERVYNGEEIHEPLDKFVARVKAYSDASAPLSPQPARAGLASADELKPPGAGI
jgi:hypothetical protein